MKSAFRTNRSLVGYLRTWRSVWRIFGKFISARAVMKLPSSTMIASSALSGSMPGQIRTTEHNINILIVYTTCHCWFVHTLKKSVHDSHVLDSTCVFSVWTFPPNIVAPQWTLSSAPIIKAKVLTFAAHISTDLLVGEFEEGDLLLKFIRGWYSGFIFGIVFWCLRRLGGVFCRHHFCATTFRFQRFRCLKMNEQISVQRKWMN